MTAINEYEKQANDFLLKTGAKIECTFLKNGLHFDSDKETRDIYEVRITRGSRSYTFNFGQSINDSGFYYTVGRNKKWIDRKHLNRKDLKFFIKMQDSSFLSNVDKIHYPSAPTNYDILECIEKYETGTFEDFCDNYGYSNDSISALKTYEACREQFKSLCALFTDEEIEFLQEIN